MVVAITRGGVRLWPRARACGVLAHCIQSDAVLSPPRATSAPVRHGLRASCLRFEQVVRHSNASYSLLRANRDFPYHVCQMKPSPTINPATGQYPRRWPNGHGGGGTPSLTASHHPCPDGGPWRRVRQHEETAGRRRSWRRTRAAPWTARCRRPAWRRPLAAGRSSRKSPRRIRRRAPRCSPRQWQSGGR